MYRTKSASAKRCMPGFGMRREGLVAAPRNGHVIEAS
jgi:hypothetical protein